MYEFEQFAFKNKDYGDGGSFEEASWIHNVGDAKKLNGANERRKKREERKNKKKKCCKQN